MPEGNSYGFFTIRAITCGEFSMIPYETDYFLPASAMVIAMVLLCTSIPTYLLYLLMACQVIDLTNISACRIR